MTKHRLQYLRISEATTIINDTPLTWNLGDAMTNKHPISYRVPNGEATSLKEEKKKVCFCLVMRP